MRQIVLFLHQKCAIIASKTCHLCVNYMVINISLWRHSYAIKKSFWNHPGATTAPLQCHCHDFSKYLAITNWLMHFQECAIFAARNLTSELCYMTLYFLTSFADGYFMENRTIKFKKLYKWFKFVQKYSFRNRVLKGP